MKQYTSKMPPDLANLLNQSSFDVLIAICDCLIPHVPSSNVDNSYYSTVVIRHREVDEIRIFEHLLGYLQSFEKMNSVIKANQQFLQDQKTHISRGAVESNVHVQICNAMQKVCL